MTGLLVPQRERVQGRQLRLGDFATRKQIGRKSGRQETPLFEGSARRKVIRTPCALRHAASPSQSRPMLPWLATAWSAGVLVCWCKQTGMDARLCSAPAHYLQVASIPRPFQGRGTKCALAIGRRPLIPGTAQRAWCGDVAQGRVRFENGAWNIRHFWLGSPDGIAWHGHSRPICNHERHARADIAGESGDRGQAAEAGGGTSRVLYPFPASGSAFDHGPQG